MIILYKFSHKIYTMRKIYLLLLAVIIINSANAQCPGGRYWDEIFPTITKDSVLYSSVYGQWMDIYQPAGDTLSARPIIILAHGGSFITGNGDRKNDPTIDSLCIRYAMRGYVTVSIDYRTMDGITFVVSPDSAINEVARAISDGKAAIRFFMNDRATTNTYKIDTNNIYAGGNSAGAVLYMHVGYLDSIGECPASVAAAINANGGFEGNSGYPGYTTKLNAIINLAGGLNETSFVGPGDKPSVNAQGNNDNVVPYYCGNPLGGAVTVTLCGLGSLEPVYVSNGIYHMSHVFPGDGHVPWSTDNVKLFTVDSMIRVFLYNFVCLGIANVNVVSANPEVTLFPNPATESVNISASNAISDLTIYDQTGRAVYGANGINRDIYEVNTSRYNKGVYFIKIRFSNDQSAPLVKRIVVE